MVTIFICYFLKNNIDVSTLTYINCLISLKVYDYDLIKVMQLLSNRAKTGIQFLCLLIQWCFKTKTSSHGAHRCISEPQLSIGKCYPSDVLARIEKMLRKNYIVDDETIIGLLIIVFSFAKDLFFIPFKDHVLFLKNHSF